MFTPFLLLPFDAGEVSFEVADMLHDAFVLSFLVIQEDRSFILVRVEASYE